MKQQVSVVSGRKTEKNHCIGFARRRLANPENLSWSHWCAIMCIGEIS